MALRRDEGFSTILQQMKPLTWLLAISFVVLLISLAVLAFIHEPKTRENPSFELRDLESLVMGEDFTVKEYSLISAKASIPELYADCLEANMDIVQLIQIEQLRSDQHFRKGFVLRFSIPEDETRQLDKRKLRIGFYSQITKAWLPLSAPFSSKEGVIYEITDTRFGWYGLGLFKPNETPK
ncbi:MAG: hypothetical protein KDB07_09135, partial [Planctomycetes bacterium]|nr:hypothetical protein [Planctomycetota bacterium]